MQPYDDVTEQRIKHQAAADGVTHFGTGLAVMDGQKVLLVRRVAHDFLGGQYELPGGGVDPGESIMEGAVRELAEETGLTVETVLGMFQGFDYSTPRKPLVRQTNFAVTVQDIGALTLNPAEHDDAVWATAADYQDYIGDNPPVLASLAALFSNLAP